DGPGQVAAAVGIGDRLVLQSLKLRQRYRRVGSDLRGAVREPDRDERGNDRDLIGQGLARFIAAAPHAVGQAAQAQGDGRRIGAVLVDADRRGRAGGPHWYVVDGTDGDA